MLTRSWGSWRTTTTLIEATTRMRNAECGMRNVGAGVARQATVPCYSAFRIPHSALASPHQLQYPEPLRILPIPAQPHPAVPPAPDELARPALAAGEHLVNDKVESDLASHVCVVPFGPGDREGDAVALIRAAPAAPDRPRHAGAVARAPHGSGRSEEHTSELQSRVDLVCRLLLEKKKNVTNT